MTFEQMEHGLKGLQDNMAVQGAMMHRVENNLDRLEADLSRVEALVARNSESIDALTKVAENQEKRLAADGEGLRVMQAAMQAFFQRMDAFIRGLESDGHKGKGKA